jgi:hypothetical protein
VLNQSAVLASAVALSSGAIFGTILCSTVAFAQEECVALARVMARETQRVGDQTEIDIQNRASLCSSEYRNSNADQRANIQAAYGLFSGGVSGSDTQIEELQKATCENHYGTYWSSQQHSTEINRVSQLGADVVRACLLARSFRLTTLQLVGEAVNASFLYGGTGETTIDDVFVTPPQIAKCEVAVNHRAEQDLSKLQGVSLKSGDNLTLNCERKPNTETVNGLLHYEGGIVGIATTSDTARVPLISYYKPPIDETVADALDRRIRSLEQQLAVLERQHAALLSDLSLTDPTNNSAPSYYIPLVTRNGTPRAPEGVLDTGPHPFTCLDGDYMIGVNLQSTNSTISSAQIMCRQLLRLPLRPPQ